jgi:hypothetical protein
MLEGGRFRFPEALIPRVNAGREALLVGNSVQQFRQPLAIVAAECGEEHILMLPRHLTDSLQDFAPILCQMQRIQPPVLGVWLPLDKLPPFQIIQDGHQAAGMNVQLLRKFLLADSRRDAQKSQDSRVRRSQLQHP